ncbi:MAG: hypothetical protein ABI612_06300 [Betaproteobacteria bacterium]
MTPFPRSIRSLEADRFRASAIGLIVAVVILGIWLGWFFLARVSVYKVANGVRLEQWACTSCDTIGKASIAVVDFPAAIALTHVRVGQTAFMHLDGLPRALYAGIRAEVSSVSTQVVEGKVRVELATQPDDDAYITLRPNLTATIEVEVERVSPAILVLRTTRRWLHMSSESEAETE